MKIVLIAMLLVVLMVSQTFAKNFSDVPSDHWAYEYINILSNENEMKATFTVSFEQ